MLRIETLPLPPIETNAYLLWKEGLDRAVLIDAPLGAYETVQPFLAERGLELELCLLTHGHWDHILGGHRLNEAGVPCRAHSADEQFFENPSLMSSFAIPGLPMNPMTIDWWIGAGVTLELLGETCEVREVPGHCPGSLLFYFPGCGVAFVGDAIFCRGVGRTDLPLGDEATLLRSIRSQIYSLPAETTLYPGHGPQTTVEDEMAHNPYARPE